VSLEPKITNVAKYLIYTLLLFIAFAFSYNFCLELMNQQLDIDVLKRINYEIAENLDDEKNYLDNYDPDKLSDEVKN
jgi:hypothetical protein